jgi:cell cycle sensor histidine kinase DivJ
VTVTARVEGANFLVAVEDTGVGISAEDLTRVGRPFFQARAAYDRRHDGTGLGVSIVQGLVALHGGEVNITSRLGEGTRVSVRLPIDCEPVRPLRKPSAVSHPAFERVAAAQFYFNKSA